MKWIFTFLIFLAVTSFSADIVCKVFGVPGTPKALMQSEEDSDEPSNEEEDPENKVKIREYEWISFNNAETDSYPVPSSRLFFNVPLDEIAEQHKSSVPFSPPEMN